MGKTRSYRPLLAPAAAPADEAADGPSTSGRAGEPHGPQRYLCYFLHRYLDFRVPEINALAGLAGCQPEQVQWESPHGDEWMSPMWYVTLPHPAAAFEVAKRAVLLRGFFEVWGEGSTWEELGASLRALPEATTAPYLHADTTFRLVIDTWGHKHTPQQKIQVFETLQGFLDFKGKVALEGAQHVFWLVSVDPLQNKGLPALQRRLYFVRQVALCDRGHYAQYALPRRRYLGPTSMDHEMAFIMCNQAHVRRGALVLDPYVGTGSILLAAAARGAAVLGADIDIRVLRLGKKDRATGRTLNIFSNFEQYGLPWPAGLLRMDMHALPLRRDLQEVLDAVVGDPPYGVRAGGRKSMARDVEVRFPDTHIPSTAPYTMTECVSDLLEVAARLLKVGGRLVFFVPAFPGGACASDLPVHPVLGVVEDTEQPLTSRYSRRLITMVKTRSCSPADAQAFQEARPRFAMEVDTIADAVYAPTAAQSADGSEQLSARGAMPRFRSKNT